MPDTTPTTPPAGAGTNGRLNTWKEIAAYVGKGVRTVERWEADLGLPVHRVRSKRGESVYALTHEIDAWLAAADRPDEPDAAPGQERVLAARGMPARSLIRYLLALVPAFVVVVIAAWLWLGPRTAPVSAVKPDPAPRLPATWRLVNGQVAVFDEAGGSLWATDFPFKFDPDVDSEARLTAAGRVLLEDIDGDGAKEVLIVACEGRGLYCYDSDGKVRFARDPKGSVRFGQVDQSGPLTVSRFWLIPERGGPPSIWLAASHALGAGVVQRLDAAGKVMSEYWGYGQVTLVRDVTIAGRRLVLVGATNKESGGSSLAVMDYRGATATAPAVRDEFRCGNCPGGSPLHFFVFPPDDVARAAGRSRSSVNRIEFDAASGRLGVRTSGRGIIGPDKAASEWSVSYTFDETFNLVGVDFGEDYRAVHGRLQELRLLRHPLNARDLRDARALRWDGVRFVPAEMKRLGP